MISSNQKLIQMTLASIHHKHNRYLVDFTREHVPSQPHPQRNWEQGDHLAWCGSHSQSVEHSGPVGCLGRGTSDQGPDSSSAQSRQT